jgi:hypothetical protein
VISIGFVVFILSLGKASAQEQREWMAEIPPAMTLTADNATPAAAPDEQLPGQPSSAIPQPQKPQAQQDSTILPKASSPTAVMDPQSSSSAANPSIPPQENNSTR